MQNLKWLVLLLVSLVLVAGSNPARGRAVHMAQLQTNTPPQGNAVPALPDIEFTLNEVVDVLAEYSVIHNDGIGCSQWFGVTDFRTKRIEICDRYDTTDRRKTVIHEMLHVIYRKKGIESGGIMELPLDAKVQLIFHQLYGVVPAHTTPVLTLPEAGSSQRDSSFGPAGKADAVEVVGTPR